MPEGIHYCVRCGAPIQLAIKFGVERPVCPQCGWIYFADPKVAAAVLVEKDGQVLLVQRRNQPYAGFWSLPAGFVDAWEDPARAAERECLEETGLVVKVTGLIDVIAGREHAQGADILIVYRADSVTGQLAAGDDASQAGFFSRGLLPPLAFKATLRVLGQ